MINERRCGILGSIEELLVENPVIAAVRCDEDLDVVLENDVKIVFVLYGSIVDIKDICSRLKEAGKIVFVHIDMIDGLKGDSKGVEYIKKVVEPFGVITTKLSNIKSAMNLGLYTIQRIFIIDSQSLQTGITNVQATKPHAVEVLPGIAYKMISIIQRDIKVPVIAGGMISEKKDVMDALSAGAVAISTSSRELWSMD
jgi:glycerol uptake operon antiterminator